MNRPVLSPPRRYSSTELDDFENRKGVRLPSAYRQYLTEVGAGEFTVSRVSLLEEWSQPSHEQDLPPDFLSAAFPYREAWNDSQLLDDAKGWHAAYYDPLLFRGSMRIVNVGGEAYYLLVVSGDEYGNVWVDDRARSAAGIYPLQRPDGGRVTIRDYLYE